MKESKMSMIINTNSTSELLQRKLIYNNSSLNSSLEKMSSGLKINKASDDASGLNISELISSKIRSSKVALNNSQDAINVLQIADSAMGVINENLQRIRELSLQAANDTNSSVERRAIAQEVQSRLADIDRIANTTRGNNINLLDGSKTTYMIQTGANGTATQDSIDIGKAFLNSRASTIGITMSVSATGTGSFFNNSTARSFLAQIDSAITAVNKRRIEVGGFQNRIQNNIDNLSLQIQNITDTNSHLKDVDFASETAKVTKDQILQQSTINVLAQANQNSNLAMKLLA